uniref:Zn_ribbon_recom domain-containing protein n=1 Tax=Schistosoma curassoni TaxID=6186 RepID=A0A183JQG1_9TREM
MMMCSVVQMMHKHQYFYYCCSKEDHIRCGKAEVSELFTPDDERLLRKLNVGETN